MAEKTFTNVRLGLKVDTLENWGKSSLVLKKGEVAFATIAASAGTGLTEPVCMMKIGDGKHTFSELKFDFYAKASDVLGACKSENALKTFINGVISDSGIATNDALSALAGRVDTLEDTVGDANDGLVKDVADLKGLVGDTAVATQITNAITALDLANTYEAKGEAAKVQTALGEYKTTNDAAVLENKNAAAANAAAITAIKDGTTIDSFKDVEEALAGKQDSGNYAAAEHTHEIANVTGLADAIADAKKAGTDAAAAAAAAQADADALEALVGETAVSAQISTAINNLKLDETYAAKEHEHTKADITDFAHKHEMADVNGLADALAGLQAKGDYAAEEHTHEIADVTGLSDAIADAKKAGTDAQDAVDALAAKVGDVPVEKTVVGMIAEAQEAATYDDTAVKNDIAALKGLVGDTAVSTQISNAVAAEAEIARAAEKANADAITKLNANAETEGSVDYKIAQKFATLMENPDEAMNSIKELVDWTTEHAADALEMSNQVTANKNAIATLNGNAETEGSVAKQVAAGVTEAKDYTDAEVKELADGAVATNASDIATLKGLVGEKAVSEQITAVTDPLAERVVALEAVDHEHDNKAVLDGIEEADVTAWDAKVDDVTAADDSGLKATRTGNTVAIEIDESVTFIFDCGGADVAAE